MSNYASDYTWESISETTWADNESTTWAKDIDGVVINYTWDELSDCLWSTVKDISWKDILTTSYLIKSEGKIYTFVNNILTVLEETDLSAELFEKKGFAELPTYDSLSSLIDPKLYKWMLSGTPKLNAALSGVPNSQCIITNSISLTTEGKTGISSMEPTYGGTPLCSFSVDNKATWKIWDSDNAIWIDADDSTSGMDISLLSSIISDNWALLTAEASDINIKIILNSSDDKVTSVKVTFTNA